MMELCHDGITAHAAKSILTASLPMVHPHLCAFRYQKQVDGDLVASGLPVVGATGVVEDLAEVIIDELMGEHALQLNQMCDALGEDLFEAEFREAQ